MSIHTGYFPPYGGRRKHTAPAYPLPLNNHQHHTSMVQSARSIIENSSRHNESFLPTISTKIAGHDSHRPYRQNDFANNHLFIAKRKLARIFLEQPAKSLQSTSDLIHLFDQPESKLKKNRNTNKQRQEHSTIKNLSTEQDAHLSVVDLIMKPPYPSVNPRDPLTAIFKNRRPQIPPPSTKVLNSSADTLSQLNKQNCSSTTFHTSTDNDSLEELIDDDNVSDSIKSMGNPFDSTLLCVKSIVPSAAPHHANHHLLQHR